MEIDVLSPQNKAFIARAASWSVTLLFFRIDACFDLYIVAGTFHDISSSALYYFPTPAERAFLCCLASYSQATGEAYSIEDVLL